ncbi:medium chain dehydrogenase/reductase family protein [Gracilibacillus halophilus]|uniref:MDR/zinc-dependent alcohol dehydrogenase-like family protein n=1 Tax=Gracilibacillus halophilus TaxID=470864 RepID=UPI0003A6212E
MIQEIGEEVTRFSVGDEVIINPSLYWYEKSEAPPANFEILGMPHHGTLAEKVAISEDFVEPKPAHFSWEEAGVFTLSAVTGYRALMTKAQIQSDDTLFILV